MARKKPAARRQERAVPPRQPAKAARKRPSAPRPRPRDKAAGQPDGSAPLTIVGVGASAGGLEAFSQVLEVLDEQAGLAVVLVQHLAPNHDSALPALLASKTRLPVVQVTDGMPLERNHVYIIPPNAQMAVTDGRLNLSDRPVDGTRYNPIDHFFRSLAEHGRNHAIGVVLSGTASDGAVGLREIKAVGGITIAQEPESARYDGMPRAAIATGAVDLVLTPEAIASELAHIARHAYLGDRAASGQSSDLQITDGQLARIFGMLRTATGVDFTHYKPPTIRRRLHRRMVLHKISGVDHYIRYLQQHPAEVQKLYQDILINVTRFFREPEAFEALRKSGLPELLKQHTDGSPLRVWVPGCATGEEAYSIAITILEYLSDSGSDVPLQVFGTDISDPAIEHARNGSYAPAIEADVSPERLRRYFSRVDGNYRINKGIRELCVFARQDVTHDPPFSRLDLIVCRNVLIYLGTVLQRKLMTVFHYALRPWGYLMLGSAETVGLHAELFAVADKKHRIYRKKAMDLPPNITFPVDYAALRNPAERKAVPVARAGTTAQQEASRVLLERFCPPAVLINGEYQIVQFRGQTGPYLEPAPGEASFSLLKMAREGLLYGLRAALTEARKSDKAVRKEGLKVKPNGHTKTVNLEVLPLLPADGERHYLVLFEEVKDAEKATSSRKSVSRAEDDERVIALERELAASREYLQSVIQDLEATNEELQSANEEILSSNEELQSTNEELDTAKEELQSTNEELNTVNEELHARNEEMTHINSDLVNLLASVNIAIVMVDGSLRIRRFTPMAEKILNLIPADVGRPISQIKPNIDCPQLEKIIHEVIDSVTMQEHEVHDQHGNLMSLRVRPYKNVENRIDGAVLALIDMAPPKQSAPSG